MRNTILSLFLLMMLPAAVLAGEAKVLAVSGDVEARLSREGDWVSAGKNMEIPEGGGIRTKAGGQVVVRLPNKTKVWLKESSALEIEQQQTLASRLALIFGKIKLRVPHLMRKEKFEVRTQTAICAVRGTEFTLEATEEGKMDLKVLFGEVKMRFTIPPAKGRAEFNIPQGQGLATAEEGKANKPVLLTAKQERAAMENWNPGLKASERQAGLIQKENDRAQVKEFAKATTQAENKVKNFLNVVKESDLEAGRTLRDVHGNVVRVDQRMMRPDGRTLQFFNLVKRPVYNHTCRQAAGGFLYSGNQGIVDRLDMARMEFVFNKDLPQRIEEWPGFFDQTSVRADGAAFIFANKTDGNSSIFTIAELYKYEQARDELINNEAVVNQGLSADRDVVITGYTDTFGLNELARSVRAGDTNLVGAGDGTLSYTGGSGNMTGLVWAQKLTPGVYYETLGDPMLYQFSADAYGVGANGVANGYLWLAKEAFVIGNGGGVKSVSDFTSSGLDPFSVMKETAIQTILYVKASGGNVNGGYSDISDNDYFSGKTGYGLSRTNIDLVFIPDLALAAVQRMLPAFTELGD